MSSVGLTLPIRPAIDSSVLPTREATIDAITQLYRLFTLLPYIAPKVLMIPPPQGWQNIDEAELRRRGKNEEVLNLLRHLPYLDQELYGAHWTLFWDTLHINYAKGETCPEYFERHDGLLPLPGHVIWLAKSDGLYGVNWLLDTQTWEAIEYRPLGETCEVPYPQSEDVPKTQQWMMHSRMPAPEYFSLWRFRYHSLDFMVIRDRHHNNGNGTGQCFDVDPMLAWETTLIPSEDEKDDSDYEEDDPSEESVSSDEEEDMEWEMVADESELQWLQDDVKDNPFPPYDERNANTVPGFEDNPRTGCRKSILFLYGDSGSINQQNAEAWNHKRDVERRSEARDLLTIFLRNGWEPPQRRLTVACYRRTPQPDDSFDHLGKFDREKCGEELDEWMRQRRERQAKIMRKMNEERNAPARTKLTTLRHKIQKSLLQADAKPTNPELMEAIELLQKLEDLDTVTQADLNATKVHLVLRTVVGADIHVDDAEGKQSLSTIRGMAETCLRNWQSDGLDVGKGPPYS